MPSALEQQRAVLVRQEVEVRVHIWPERVLLVMTRFGSSSGREWLRQGTSQDHGAQGVGRATLRTLESPKDQRQ